MLSKIRCAICFALFCLLGVHTLNANTSHEYYHKILSKSKETVAADSLEYIHRIDSLKSLSPTWNNAAALGHIVSDICADLYNRASYHSAISYASYCYPMLKIILPKTVEAYKVYINLLDQCGMAYLALELNDQSLSLFMKALAVAEEQNLSAEKAILYNNIGGIYQKKECYEVADSAYMKAVKINEAEKDKEKLFINYNNLSVCRAKQNDYNKALEFAFLAIHQLDEADSDLRMLVQRNIAGIYLRNNERSLALRNCREVMQYQESRQQLPYLANTYRMMAEIHEARSDSFAVYLNKAYDVAVKLGSRKDRASILHELAKYYAGKGNYEKENACWREYNQVKDSVFEEERRIQVENLLNVYADEERQFRLMEELREERNDAERRMFGVLAAAVALLVVAVLCGWWIWKRREKLNFQKVKGRLRQKIRETAALAEKMEKLAAKIESQEVQSDLNEKKRTVLALQVMRGYEFMEVLIADLKQLLLKLSLRDSETKRQVRAILLRLDQMNNENIRKEFVDSFENISRKFYDGLSCRYPNLTAKELRMCALIRLGMSSKEIADTTFREVRSVEAVRNRLRKKFGLDQQEDLARFLRQF